MSWFTDLAGKAEDFLNKVDQSAAVVLQKDEAQGNYSDTQSRVAEISRPRPAILQPKPSYLQKPKISSNSDINVIKSVGLSPQNKPKKRELDEDLLKFLNSSETTTADTPNSTHNPEISLVKSKSSEILTEKDEKISSKPVAETETNGSIDDTDGLKEPLDTSEPKAPEESFEENNENRQKQRLSGLELENKLLRREVTSLNNEVAQALNRAKTAEAEIVRVKQQVEQREGTSDRLLRELQANEGDLRQALDAKDSQLAVLRVRIQESDQKFARQKTLVDRLQAENERLLGDHSSSSSLHNQAIQTLSERLRDAESTLERERVHLRNVQDEGLQRTSRLEEEVTAITSTWREFEERLKDEKANSSGAASRAESLRQQAEASRKELTDYKQKAQRILQSKEKIIAAMKEGSGGERFGEAERRAAEEAELEELRQERDLLKEELARCNQSVTRLRAEVGELEGQMQVDSDAAANRARGFEDLLKEERRLRGDLEQEVNQLKEELHYLRDDYTKQRTSFQTRIQDRELEMEKLRKQLTARQMNSSGHAELESRLSALTESLIQKQTMVEALSTEKTSLVLQLERMEQQAKESRVFARPSSTAVSLSDDDARLRMNFMSESPFDGNVTRKVKKVYNSIDSVGMRIGVFLRRYPIARILVIVYMVMLHLWVLIVLSTYEPEIHPKDYQKPNGK